MRILQIAATYSEQCGVGNFARNIEVEVRRRGVDIRTVTELGAIARHDADVVLLHHEWGFLDDTESVRRSCAAGSAPVALFAHSQGTGTLQDAVDGFVTMASAMVETTRPVLLIPHPAWTPGTLADRDELKHRFGLPTDRVVVGSSGFIRYDKEFPAVLSGLLPLARSHGWFVELVTSRWYKHQECPGLEEELQQLRKEFDGFFRYETRFLDTAELNRRLQACDLLWCWTRSPSKPYGSGSVSDQYASGTRVFAADKQQHGHVLRLPNAMPGPPELPEFVPALAAQAHRLTAERAQGLATRHDPSPVSWEQAVDPLLSFLGALRR